MQPDSAWGMSYWEYLPSNYLDVPEDHRYPMILMLGGIQTTDEVSVCPELAQTCTISDCEALPSPDGICRVYRRGPARLFREGSWDDVQRPFLVVQPQNAAVPGSATDYDRDQLDALVQFVVDNYPVDPRRLYIMGGSQGGRAVLQYLAVYNRRMAAASVGASGIIAESDVGCLLEDTVMWAFHGENDNDTNIAEGVFDPCFISRNIRRANEPEAFADTFASCVARQERPFPESRITMFQQWGHDVTYRPFEQMQTAFNQPAWTEDEMCGFETNWVQYDEVEQPDGAFGWLLDYDRPAIEAGEDVVIPGDVASFTLEATVVDDDATTVTWTQTGGPAVTLTEGGDGTVVITNFEYDAAYAFSAFVVDADNQWNEDTLEVTVESEIVEVGSSSSSSSGDAGETSGGTSSSTGSGSGIGSTGLTGGSTTGSGGVSSGTAGSTSEGDPGPLTSSSSGLAPTSTLGEAGSGADSSTTDPQGEGDAAASSDGCRVGGGSAWEGLFVLALGRLRRRSFERRRAHRSPL